METKKCTKCSEVKPLPEFSKKAASKDGYGYWCKKCMCKHNKDRYQNDAKVRLDKKNYDSYNRPAYIRHNLTKDQYEDLLSRNNGICEICNIKKAVVIDHDHSCCKTSFSCGKCVRGILCHGCNMVIGFANDSIKTLEQSIKYLAH